MAEGFRKCLGCSRNIVTKKDLHQKCMVCLGKAHDTLTCEQCQSFAPATLLVRRLRVCLWRLHDSKKPPVSRKSSVLRDDLLGYMQGQQELGGAS